MMTIIVYNMYLKSKVIFWSSIEFKLIAVVSCIKRCLIPKYVTLSKWWTLLLHCCSWFFEPASEDDFFFENQNYKKHLTQLQENYS